MKYLAIIFLLVGSVQAQECKPDSPWHFLKKGEYVFNSDIDVLEFSGTLNKRIYMVEACFNTEAESTILTIANDDGTIERECRTTLETGECCEPIKIMGARRDKAIRITSSERVKIIYEVRGCLID